MFTHKQTEKENMILGNMMGDKELEMYLNESPYHLHQNHRQGNHNMFATSSVSPISLSPFGYETPNTNYLDPSVSQSSSRHMLGDFDLCDSLFGMQIGGKHKDCSNLGGFGIDPDGFRLGDHVSYGNSPYNVDHCYPIEGFKQDFRSPVGGYSQSSYAHNKASFLGLPQGYNVGTSMESYHSNSHSPVMYSEPSCQNGLMDYIGELQKDQGRAYCDRGVHLQNPSMSRPYGNDALYCSQKYGIDINGQRSCLNPQDSYPFMDPDLALGVENPAFNGLLIKQKTSAIPNFKINPTELSSVNAGDIEGFNLDDALVIQGKRVKFVSDNQCDRSRGRKKNPLDENSTKSRHEKRRGPRSQYYPEGICQNDLAWSRSLLELQGIIYFMAKDQHGCRFLQKKFDEGTSQEMQIIFDEIIDHIDELMVNPFGNYLVQKLLEVCSEEQRMQIVLMVTAEPWVLVRICLNQHGTCVVQKLIETLKTRQQMALLTMALKPGFLDLIKDVNGNHVLQRCLLSLGEEHNKFIFVAATKYCVEIATDRHGCCVLNKCIAHSTGKYREILVSEICANGLLLAQDSFGNYVVQHIIELKIPSAAAILLTKFEGHYVYLSTQKFSSHVVEKLLRCHEESRPRVIHDFLSVPHFDQLLQDPFANYVLQSALEVSKGPLHAALVEAVQPHAADLRTSPYCKKLFSRKLLKKRM